MPREFIAEGEFVDPVAVSVGRATEVVRCGGCKWFRAAVGCGFTFCEWWHRKVPRHGFCHHGERQDGAGR